MNQVFLIATERSGSNLLTQIINSHSTYFGTTPAHLYRMFLLASKKFYPLEDDKIWADFLQNIVEAYNLKFGDDWNSQISYEELLKNVPQREILAPIDYIYEKEANSRQKQNIFVKEVKTYKIFSKLLREKPESKFIFLVRDPRDVAISWSKSAVHRGDIVRAANVWKEDQRATINLLKTFSLDNVICLVKYEDLISKSSETLQLICEFLNIDYEEKMLDFHKGEYSKRASSSADSWKNLNQNIQQNNFNKFKTELDSKQIQFIEKLCKEEMSYLGYNFSEPELTLNEYIEVRNELEKQERYSKPEYLNLSQKERDQKEVWYRFFEKLVS